MVTDSIGWVESFLCRRVGRPRLVALIDPDSQTPNESADLALAASYGGAEAIFVGGSTAVEHSIVNATVAAIIEAFELLEWGSTQDLNEIDSRRPPIILFPSASEAISQNADAILFMSLLNSTDRRFIVGEQLEATLILENLNLERLPTGYIITEPGGRVGKVGQAALLPRDATELMSSYASLAAGFGMRFLYVEAGSGASQSVSSDLILAAKRDDQTLIVGGGIKDIETMREVAAAEPDWIVIGTLIETCTSLEEVTKKIRGMIQVLQSVSS